VGLKLVGKTPSPILIGQQINGQPQMSKPSRPADAMKIRFGILRKIEIDHDVYGLNIDTSGEEVRANKIAAHAVSKIVKDAITVGLKHFGV
jgi:hypothetical protein